MKLTNVTKLPLSLAVWLSHDPYQYDPNAISATALLRSTRQIVLKGRLESDQIQNDVAGRIPSSFGHAVHDSIQRSWEDDLPWIALRKMGYSEAIIGKVRINPSQDVLDANPGCIPVYIEQRFKRDITINYIDKDGVSQTITVTITGQLDFCAEGVLEDFKTTGAYNFMMGSNDEKYRRQGSIYRWLRPKIINAGHMFIRFIFTDWSKLRSLKERSKGYPQSKIESKKFALDEPAITEAWIKDKLIKIYKAKDLPEDKLPLCTKEELWQQPSVFKFYSDPAKRKRSSGNFPTYEEAQIKNLGKGGTGIVIEVHGKVKACNYCDAFEICTQKDQLISAGLLEE